jgi:hypothetical protein
MKLALNSGLFSVRGPDGYWVFGELLNVIEADADYWHEEDRVSPDDHPALFSEMEGRLEIPNPDWRPGHYEMDYGKFLDGASRYWVDRFKDRLSETGVQAKVKYTGHWSPKEYNFRSDEADFALTISKAEVARLVALCLADERFPERLHDLYAGRDGFMSFVTDDVAVFAENAEGLHGPQEYERAVWQALNFILFPDAETSELWSADYVYGVNDLDFSDALCFVEDKEEATV